MRVRPAVTRGALTGRPGSAASPG